MGQGAPSREAENKQGTFYTSAGHEEAGKNEVKHHLLQPVGARGQTKMPTCFPALTQQGNTAEPADTG